MANYNFSTNDTSAALEKVAISRFRSLLAFLPEDCRVFREKWGDSTAICLDFANCPELLNNAREQSFLLLLVANYLGLASSIIFRIERKVLGWKTIIDS